MKFYLSFEYHLEGANGKRKEKKKNGETTGNKKKRRSIVKCGEILFEGGLWKSCWTLHV